MNVYVLTNLTRTVSQQRRVVIQGFDLPVRGLTIAGLAFLPAIPVTAIAWMIVGQYALVCIPTIELLAFWLIESRTRSGMQLRRYQRFLDMRRSVSGTFMVCNRPIKPLQHVFGYVVASSEPGVPAEKPSFVRAPTKRSRGRR